MSSTGGGQPAALLAAADGALACTATAPTKLPNWKSAWEDQFDGGKKKWRTTEKSVKEEWWDIKHPEDAKKHRGPLPWALSHKPTGQGAPNAFDWELALRGTPYHSREDRARIFDEMHRGRQPPNPGPGEAQTPDAQPAASSRNLVGAAALPMAAGHSATNSLQAAAAMKTAARNGAPKADGEQTQGEINKRVRMELDKVLARLHSLEKYASRHDRPFKATVVVEMYAGPGLDTKRGCSHPQVTKRRKCAAIPSCNVINSKDVPPATTVAQRLGRFRGAFEGGTKTTAIRQKLGKARVELKFCTDNGLAALAVPLKAQVAELEEKLAAAELEGPPASQVGMVRLHRPQETASTAAEQQLAPPVTPEGAGFTEASVSAAGNTTPTPHGN